MIPPDRPRDADGRPRNARPRDAMGRPLTVGETGVERVPDNLFLPAAEALAEAQRLVDAGLPFNAHEVLEASWKAAPADEKPLWRSLAQLAVGLTHAQRGNSLGAQTLLRRGCDGLQPTSATTPYDIPVDRLRAEALRLAALSEEGIPYVPTLTFVTHADATATAVNHSAAQAPVGT